jgi:hypothetical protein
LDENPTISERTTCLAGAPKKDTVHLTVFTYYLVVLVLIVREANSKFIDHTKLQPFNHESIVTS